MEFRTTDEAVGVRIGHRPSRWRAASIALFTPLDVVGETCELQCAQIWQIGVEPVRGTAIAAVQEPLGLAAQDDTGAWTSAPLTDPQGAEAHLEATNEGVAGVGRADHADIAARTDAIGRRAIPARGW